MSAPPRIRYLLRLEDLHRHFADVAVEIDGVEGGSAALVLPSWTPGSYLVRDYARHVQEFSAEADGKPATWRKTWKDRWEIGAPGARSVRARFRVYANELTVRTSHLDDTHGFFNGATVFPFVEGRTDEPAGLIVDLPTGWSVATGLEADARPPAAPGGRSRSAFRAPDYDELIDSPIECGTHRTLVFRVDGIEHRIALWGTGNEDETTLLSDTKAIVETCRDLFGSLPYPSYCFILHLAEGRGGLEHRNSCALLVDRWGFRPTKSYENALALIAHEFFHVWNVKRIRPEPLGPFDYRRENPTRHLWAMEGITAYYERLVLLRAGRIDRERFLERLAEDIATLEATPGRRVQSLEASSLDAWTHLYRPDEHSGNRGVSYYLKGKLVAVLLDVAIRDATGGSRSLDDVLRHLHASFPPEGPGFGEADGFVRAVESVAGESAGAWRAWYDRCVAGTEELDWDSGLAPMGLELFREPEEGRSGWLGVTLEAASGAVRVLAVRADGPGAENGLHAGDEIVAFDGFRVDAASLAARLGEREPGETVRLALFRRGALRDVDVELGATPPGKYRIATRGTASPNARALLDAWLPPASPGAPAP